MKEEEREKKIGKKRKIQQNTFAIVLIINETIN